MAMDAKPEIHHLLVGKRLKEKMDQLGIRYDVYTGRELLGGGQQLSIVEFIKQEFAKTRATDSGDQEHSRGPRSVERRRRREDSADRSSLGRMVNRFVQLRCQVAK